MSESSKPLFSFIGIAIVILGFAIGITTCISRCQDNKIEELEQNISELKEEFIPVRFVKTTKKDKIYVNMTFYNKDDKKIRTKKITFKEGKEIFFDFKTVRINSNESIFFPYMVFTDMIAPENGEKIYEEYSSGKKQKLYNFSDKEISNLVDEYFDKIVNNEFVDSDTVKGGGVHDLDGIKTFLEGRSYAIVCHNKTGAIEIREEE